jgi:UDP-N-acetylglucosamine diphosphorylase/glucosamine-1-phosphate N-acetyltransferase
MESDLAKVLHPLCGRPLLAWVLQTAAEVGAERVVAVVGHQANRVQAAVQPLFPDTLFAVQHEMKGTGHAVQQAETALAGFAGDIVVTCGDVPLVSAATYRRLIEARSRSGAAASMLVATVPEPGHYGRVISDGERVLKIVEYKDATPEERDCCDVNAGTYCFDAAALWSQLGRIEPNNLAGEYYLTDMVGLLNSAGATVVAVEVSEREMTGINTRAQLQALEAELKAEGACRDV